MTDITGVRLNIQEEEARFRSAVSENLMTRAGGAVNFINNFQHLIYQFNINGEYGVSGAQAQIDGLMGILFNVEITGAMVFGYENTGSGTTVMDLHRITSGGTDSGTIFSTKPSIATSAGAGAYATRDLLTPVDYTATGITLPAFSVTSLDAGDALRFDLDSTMSTSENCGLHIFYRPR